MATRDDMVARIVSELGGRTDLTIGGANPNAILDAINTAITAYQTERFRFNETRPLTPFTFNMTPLQSIYTAVDDPRIGLIMAVDWIYTVVGETREEVDRVMPAEVYLPQTQNNADRGFPLTWALDGNSLVFYPTPDIVYPLTIGAHLAAAAPAAGNEVNNPWMNEAEMLIRSRAKYEIAVHVTRNPQLQQLMSPHNPGGAAYEEFERLKGEFNKLVGRGRVRAMPW